MYKELINEKDKGTFADFMETFKTFDREGQGFISGAELRHVLCSLGKTRTILIYIIHGKIISDSFLETPSSQGASMESQPQNAELGQLY